jgi:hypothetical protein
MRLKRKQAKVKVENCKYRWDKGVLTMAIAKLKTGETIELPFEEMLTFIAQNPDLIQEQHSETPLPKRRSLMVKEAATSK